MLKKMFFGRMIFIVGIMLVLTLTGCGGNQLSANRWANGAITSNNSSITYSFNARNGTTYYIWTNDGYEGDDSKTLDIVFKLFDNNRVYGDGDDYWENPYTFTAPSNGRVSITVTAYSPPETGTYAIAFSTNRTRPR